MIWMRVASLMTSPRVMRKMRRVVVARMNLLFSNRSCFVTQQNQSVTCINRMIVRRKARSTRDGISRLLTIKSKRRSAQCTIRMMRMTIAILSTTATWMSRCSKSSGRGKIDIGVTNRARGPRSVAPRTTGRR